MKSYDPSKIEKKWQKYWEKKKLYEAKDKSKQPKFYGLIEFPFPSGIGMHVGHLRSNTGIDIISRKRRMQGFNVLYPIGWDAFGLPTENYAIKTKLHPKIVTKQNTDNFRKQLKSAGFSFDWSREIDTTDPAYYKWTQWIFLQMYKQGLAYKKRMLINWCPKDKIGLANEEVVDGKCERCGTEVEKREKEQWMLAITKYADRLDKDLDTVDYQEKIKIQQRNWIGKSEGALIDFKISDSKEKITVFTTRADTLFGVTYVVLAPENDLVLKLKEKIGNWSEVEKYIEDSKKKNEADRLAADKTKTGVELKGVKAINPANNEEVPVWIADYVLASYGTGAVMAVPAHDERDWDFAKKNNLPVKEVIEPCFIAGSKSGSDAVRPEAETIERNAIMAIVKHWSEDKYIGLKWKKVDWQTLITGGPENGQTAEEGAITEIKEETGYQNLRLVKRLSRYHSLFYHVPKKVNRFAHFDVFYFELKDGEKIEPTDVEKENHEVVWLTAKEMDTFLTPPGHKYLWQEFSSGKKPYIEADGILADSKEFSGMMATEAKNKIAEKFGKLTTTYKLRDWIFSRQRYWGEPIPMIHCEKCGWVPVPEKDLPVKLPNVKKYEPTDTGESPLAAISKWVNTKCPNCKCKAVRETDTMPNWAGSSWYYLRYVDPKNKKAFADKKKIEMWTPVDWYNGGMEHTTLHLLYSRFWHKFLFDQGLVQTSEPYQKRTSHGLILAADGAKISKSKGNSIDPDVIIKNIGADSLRLYEMFMGPFEQAVSWTEDGIVGPRRFLDKVWRLQEKVNKKVSPSKEIEIEENKTIKKVSEDIEAMRFNTAISSMMIFTNLLEGTSEISQKTYESLLKLLAPFAPFITEEIWANLGHKKSIHTDLWPEFDESKTRNDSVNIVVQISGKVRATFQALRDISQEDAIKVAKNLPEIKKWIDGKSIVKEVFVPGKLVNIVIS